MRRPRKLCFLSWFNDKTASDTARLKERVSNRPCASGCEVGNRLVKVGQVHQAGNAAKSSG